MQIDVPTAKLKNYKIIGGVMKRSKSLFVFGLVLFVTLFTVISSAKDNRNRDAAYYQKLIRIFPESLNSNIPGIVESTIYNIVVLKKYYPSGDYDHIIDMLNRISDQYPEPSIRYKAHLASMYLSMSNIVVHPLMKVEDHGYIFKQIADQLENKLLVSN